MTYWFFNNLEIINKISKIIIFKINLLIVMAYQLNFILTDYNLLSAILREKLKFLFV